MKKTVFEGAASAIVTPFTKGKPDIAQMKKLIDFQISGGISAIVLCGTTGEAATLSREEKQQIFYECTEYINHRAPVICGVGSNNPTAALDAALSAADCGADAVLMVTPYYNKTSQEGLAAHFFHVADRCPLPMIVYNVPGRTGIAISPDTYCLLAEHPNIVGVKEASGNLAAFAGNIARCGDKLVFWSGNDADTVAMMALGARGVISVASNIVPAAVSELCRLCLSGSYSEAAGMNRRYAALFEVLFTEVNPIPVKAAMEYLGLCSGELRLPLLPLEQKKRDILFECINNLQISKNIP